MLNNPGKNRLEGLHAKGLLRERYNIDARNENKIILDGSPLINFSSNDYLGLATNPQIKKAMVDGVNEYGAGSGSASLISGFCKPHQLLEEKFSEFLKTDKAILFNTGYLANLGVITALSNRHHTIVSDKLCHASLLDGIQLSRAKHYRYAHGNVEQAQRLLTKNKHTLLITESVFSMEGDIAPIDQLAALTKKAHAALIVDDAHGIGILGQGGRGILEHFNLNQEDITALIAPLGKAIGSMGALVAGKKEIIDTIIQFARSYRYSTALPPAIAVATLASLNILEQETWRREKLHHLISFFIRETKSRSLPLISDDLTPIKSILIGSNQSTLKIKKHLLDHGFFISCIRPPTVPNHTARIRISLNCLHEEREIILLLDLLADAYEKFRTQ